MDRGAVPQGQMIEFPEEVACGDWESSGVLDVTDLFPDTNGKTLLILDVQAHGVAGGGIGGLEDIFPGFPAFLFDLNEGGQLLLAESPSPFPTAFVRGDCNDDGNVDIADVSCLVNVLFAGFNLLDRSSPDLPCATDGGNVAILDVSGNEAIDVADIVDLANFLFGGGPPPPGGTSCQLLDGEFGCPENPGCQ